MLTKHLICIQLPLDYCSLCPQFLQFNQERCSLEKKTQVPNEWYTCKVLKSRYVILVGVKRIFLLQNGVTKFKISQSQGAVCCDTALTHVSEATPTFQQYCGSRAVQRFRPEINGLGRRLSNFCLEPTVKNVLYHYLVNTYIW